MPDSFWSRLFENPETIGIMVPIVAIVAFAIVVILKLLIRHRERMAMIERGMHPDYPPEDADEKRIRPQNPNASL
jgi:hypothetical protein